MTNGNREWSAVIQFADRDRQFTFCARGPASAWRWITNWAIAQRGVEESPPLSITLHELDSNADTRSDKP